VAKRSIQAFHYRAIVVAPDGRRKSLRIEGYTGMGPALMRDIKRWCWRNGYAGATVAAVDLVMDGEALTKDFKGGA
jgi:hypothetical protein